MRNKGCAKYRERAYSVWACVVQKRGLDTTKCFANHKGMDMVYSIAEIQRIVIPIIEKYHIPAMYLLGSYARGEATVDSDLDFMVDTTGTDLTSLLRLGALYCDLEEAFNKRIDLITEQSIMQNTLMDCDDDFRNVIPKERVKLNHVNGFATE